MTNDHLSLRGQRAAETTPRIDLKVYFEALSNLYHPGSNPTGAFPLNMAENKLCWHLLKAKMKEVCSERIIEDWVPGYTSALGEEDVRTSIANFLTNFLAKVEIDPNTLAISSGATAVIETSAFLLCGPGDVVAFPAPSYPVYKQDISTFPQLSRYNITTHYHLDEVVNRPILLEEDLERSYRSIKENGGQLRMVVLTHPDNPTGRIYKEEDLQWIADWCIERRIHLVVNEIYGLSLLNISHSELQEDYNDPCPFRSFAEIMKDRKSPYLHQWYAFSKDFGISGLRVGVLHSHNEHLIRAYGNVNLSKMVSNHTQWIIKYILDDTNFLTDYIDENRRLLTKAYLIVVKTLRQLQIPYLPSRGSLFVWIDLSEFLQSSTQEAEEDFWMKLYGETGILLTPGSGFGHRKKGQFRVVCTFLPIDHLTEAMKKFKYFIVNIRSS